MQPVQFQCGHCGKTMAVGSEHLGKQVRCPHCQQVVVAPPPAAPPPAPAPIPAPVPSSVEASPPAPSPVEAPAPELTETVLHTPAPPSDVEDIFSSTDMSEDLFGRSEAPRIEMPPEPQATTLPGDNAIPPPEPPPASPLPWTPLPEPAAAPAFPSIPFGNSGTDVLPSSGLTPWDAGGATEVLASPPAETPPAAAEESSAPLSRRHARTEPKAPWFLLLVFLPLLLFSIVMTVSTVWLYLQVQDANQRLRKRFEIMPDEGDKPGVQKGKQISLWKYDAKLPTLPLPENLRTTLDKPIRIGDLEVTPDRVERKRVKVVVETYKPEFCAGDSLVLYLKMKNLSSEYAFAPLDNYFDRRWEGGARPPFTLLEVGDKYQFYGGPAEWYPRGDPSNQRRWVEGRHNLPEVLQPGQEKELFVCTNGDDPRAVAVLSGGSGRPYHGSFLWRVRVRRGLVHFEGKDYSTTAVIGVRFTDKDVHEAPPEAQ